MLFGLLFSMKSEAANVTAFLAALLLIQLLIGYFVFIWETRKNAISNWTLNRFNHFMVVSLHWLNEISGRQGNLTTSEELKQFDYSRKNVYLLACWDLVEKTSTIFMAVYYTELAADTIPHFLLHTTEENKKTIHCRAEWCYGM